MPRTGTDDLPVKNYKITYKPAYKKLAKNPYFDSHQSSSDGISEGEDAGPLVHTGESHKSIHLEGLGTLGQGMSSDGIGCKGEWAGVDLNHRHTDFQSVAQKTQVLKK